MSPESSSKDKEKPVCFVIMPISDIPGYDSGHFGRVYEHLLKPAIAEAGYIPVRADDTNKTDYIVVSVVQKVVDSAIVLCDYSARNPNVLYELGIRHAFNRPVVLVKDTHTEKVFDIQGLRYTEYDPALRVDTVQKDISRISNAIKETASSKEEAYNSVVHLAGLAAAQIPEKQTISPETHVLLSAIANLERRFEALNIRNKNAQRYISFDNEQVKFSDGSVAQIGDEISDENNDPIGVLVDINAYDEQIFVQLNNGTTVPYSSTSIKSKKLSGEFPF